LRGSTGEGWSLRCGDWCVPLKQKLKSIQRVQVIKDRRARPRGGRRIDDLVNEEREERVKLMAEYLTRDKPKRN
jgi:hypothetical protein